MLPRYEASCSKLIPGKDSIIRSHVLKEAITSLKASFSKFGGSLTTLSSNLWVYWVLFADFESLENLHRLPLVYFDKDSSIDDSVRSSTVSRLAKNRRGL